MSLLLAEARYGEEGLGPRDIENRCATVRSRPLNIAASWLTLRAVLYVSGISVLSSRSLVKSGKCSLSLAFLPTLAALGPLLPCLPGAPRRLGALWPVVIRDRVFI